jgi:hypothetical protein
MSSEQLPGPQYHTYYPPPSAPPQSLQLPPISTPQSSAPTQATPRETSQIAPTPPQLRSRARPSCLECRRRKRRCDRMQPCSQCVTDRKQDLCQFGSRTISCFECRSRKRRCDRMQPCSQCVTDRKQDLCQFASAARPAKDDNSERAGKRMRIEDVLNVDALPPRGRAEEISRSDASATRSSEVLDRLAMFDVMNLNALDPRGRAEEISRSNASATGSSRCLDRLAMLDNVSSLSDFFRYASGLIPIVWRVSSMICT